VNGATSSICVVGEALADVISRPGIADLAVPGGSPLNVAVGLARLGLDVALHTTYGSDTYGQLIRAYLAENRVDVGPPDRDPTSVARVIVGTDGAPTYEFDVRWRLTPIEVNAATRHIHVGSIGALLEPGASVVAQAVAAARATASVSYDLNIRPQLLPPQAKILAAVDRFVSQADIVKASDEDVAWAYPGRTPEEVAAEWLESGVALAVVTRGADGAYLASANGVVTIPAATASVVDTIGAGDSFMAGLIAALDDRGLLGAEHRSALRVLDTAEARRIGEFAARCAAVTVRRNGADLPRRADL